MKTDRLQVRVMLLLGVAVCLILPGVLASRALRTAHAGGSGASRQVRTTEALDAARAAALSSLLAQLKAGAPFSAEEGDILRRYSAGANISVVEADVLISRALYEFYIQGNDLSPEHQELLLSYEKLIAPREINIADRKAHVVALEAKQTPRAPQVAPTNDLCAGAEVIPGAGPFPFLTAVTADITDATVTGDPPAPSCQPTFSRSIWYTFTPSATSAYTISSCADAPTGSTVDDTLMAIYTSAGGCAGPFTEIPLGGLSDGCDDDSCNVEGLQAIINTSLTSGTQYFIVIWKFGATAPTAGNTAVQLRVSQVPAATNDTCAGAIPLTLNTPRSDNTILTVNDFQLSGAACFTGVGQASSTAPGPDVVYTFTAPAAGNFSFRVTDAPFNAVVYVASTCPAGAPPQTVATCLKAANRSSAGADEVNCLALTASQQVFVFVDSTVAGASGTFTIEATQCIAETEPNGTPATANSLACGLESSSSPGADVDFYTLGTPGTGSRVFAMSDSIQANTADLQFRVTTSTDTLEFDDDDGDIPFGSAGFEPVIAGTPTTGAATFLRVNPFSTVTTSEPHRIYSVVQPPGGGLGGSSATAETEPNNTTAQANSAANNFFSGALAAPAPSTDVDIFSFAAAAGDLVFVALDCDPLRNNTPIDGALALLNPAGAVLVSVNGSGALSSTVASPGTLTGTTPNSPAEGLVFRIRTAGTYFARVTIGTTSTGATGTGDYLLSISVNCAAAGGGGGGCTSITCPVNVTQTNDPNQCGAVVTYSPATANGDCGTITCSPASGSFFPVGTTTVTCTSSAGPTCTFTVTVTDDQPPTITCPANITVSNDPNQCGAVVNYPPPTVTDNCPGTFTATCTPASGSFFPVGTTTVTCEVDGFGGMNAPNGAPGCTTITQSTSQAIEAGNSVACFDPQSGTTTDNRYWRAFSLPTFGINGVFDVDSVDIGIEEATSGGGAGKVGPKGVKTPKGARKPSITHNSKVAGPAGAGQPLTVNIYTSSQPFPTGFPGSLTLIGTTSINVADQSGTIINIPITGTAGAGSELVVEVFSPDGLAAGNAFFIGSNTAPETGPSYLSAADCGIPAPLTTGQLGFGDMHIVMNVNGCEQIVVGGGPSCTFTVTVNDTQPPTITCPPNVTAVTALTCPASSSTVVDFPPPTASDNCPGVTVVCSPASGSVFPVGTTTVTCTATDASGNTATCTFTLSVFDVCLQDDSDPSTKLLINSFTGYYRFLCEGTIYVGKGKVSGLACDRQLIHNPFDRRVRANWTVPAKKGNAAIQSPPGTIRCTLGDSDMTNNDCAIGLAEENGDPQSGKK